MRDYEAYWDLLPSGGGMLVDDLSWIFHGSGFMTSDTSS